MKSRCTITLIAVVLTLLMASWVNGQQMVIANAKCLAGPYTITFTSSHPVSFGTSAKINDGFNTSSTFNSILAYSKEENSFYFRVEKTSENGDFFIFNSPNSFAISYNIMMDFVLINSETTNLKIPPFGYERLFTSNLLHSTTNTLSLTNLNTDCTVKIAYTFSKGDIPNYDDISLTTAASNSMILSIPSRYTASSNIPFYIYIQCTSSSGCDLQLKITEVSFTQPQTYIDSSEPPTAASGNDMQSVYMDELLEAIPSVAYLIGSIIIGLIVCSCCICCLSYCLIKRQRKKAKVVGVDASTETSFRFVTAFSDKQQQQSDDSSRPTLAFVPSHSFNKGSSNVMMQHVNNTTYTQVELPQPSAADVIVEQLPQYYPTCNPSPSSASGNNTSNNMMMPSSAEKVEEELQPVVMYQTININQEPSGAFDIDPNFKV